MRCSPTSRCLFFAAVVAVIARPLPAQVIVVPTFEVAQPTLGVNILGGDVAVAPDGSLVFIWAEYIWNQQQHLGTTAAMTRHFSADGVALGPPVRVDSIGLWGSPKISIDVSDVSLSAGLVGAWSRFVRLDSQGNGLTYPAARRLDYSGQPAGEEQGIFNTGYETRVAALASRTVFLWQASGALHQLSFVLWGPAVPIPGLGDAGAFPVVDGRVYGYYLDVKAMPDGGILTTWFDSVTHLSWGRLFDPDGTERGPAFLLSDRMAVVHAAVSPRGGFAVVGSYTDPNVLSGYVNSNQLFVRWFADDGSPLGDPVLVYDGEASLVKSGGAQFDHDGNLYVTWGQYNIYGPPLYYPAKARAFDANGTPFGPAVEIDAGGDGVALLPDGRLVNFRASGWARANVVSVCPPGGACSTPLPTNTPTPTPVPPVCGDSIVGRGEECDDGNLVDGDGCDSNCTVTRCGNGIVTASEQCDDGNLLDGDGCDSNCTFTGCGNGIVTNGEQCDDGNLTDGDGCQADCTRTPVHDSVVVPIDPLKLTIPAGQTALTKVVHVQVRNADIVPRPERPGHVIQLIASDGDCPPGTIDGLPDFDHDMSGDQDSALVTGGATKTADVSVMISRDSFPNSDTRVPQRCTLRFTAQTAPDGTFEPTPNNNSVTVELNVLDSGANSAAARVAAQSASVQPFFIVSARPAKLLIRRGASTITKTTSLMVSAARGATVLSVGQPITVTASDGSCPAGTVGVSDFNPRLTGAQNVVTLGAGRSMSGKLPITVAGGGFTAANAKSPGRCTALITTSTPGLGLDATNQTTKLIIEVTDYNDF